mmetsp:Transcript_55613/g.125084  ORF Transcript_55613/g.125084 Transcript_55613/m.125084 type:complete len:167 (+) Transcript_55613:2632-3132(+)
MPPARLQMRLRMARLMKTGAVVEPDAGDLDTLTDRFRSELQKRRKEHMADDSKDTPQAQEIAKLRTENEGLKRRLRDVLQHPDAVHKEVTRLRKEMETLLRKLRETEVEAAAASAAAASTKPTTTWQCSTTWSTVGRASGQPTSWTSKPILGWQHRVGRSWPWCKR